MEALDSEEDNSLMTGVCPDKPCSKRLTFFKQYAHIECGGCGQTHAQTSLKDVQTLNHPNLIESLSVMLAPKHVIVKKGTDSVKVNGLSNYHCKILSQFLTKYGMDKNGEPKLLTELGRAPTFDCSVLGSRAFLLEPGHLDVMGYGRDQSGSVAYLDDTLSRIYQFNGDRQCLVPIHADGDGHCLVHAISRALVGRELFWHALRENLLQHFVDNVQKYRILFRDFIDEDEWSLIITECQPDYVPYNGEPLGMRNIHIFGLANVLKRPIILLDSLAGIQSLGDYTGVFLPCLVRPEECRGADGVLNKPLCIAWSSNGRNHYIPLVAVKADDNYLPRLPRRLLPHVWGVEGSNMEQYIEFDHLNSCVIGGDKSLKDSYLQRLAQAMDRIFASHYSVHAPDVADVHHYIYTTTELDGSTPEQVIEYTRRTQKEHRLYRCLTCEAVNEYLVDGDLLVRGGHLYGVALRNHGPLKTGHHYVFGHSFSGVTCEYDDITDSLVPDYSLSQMSYCNFCQGAKVRRMLADGGVEYRNGDKTRSRAPSSGCPCGFKHYWDGKEYDYSPEILPVTLEWNGTTLCDDVYWWERESDPSLNSNVYTTAQLMVQKHFPGEFGSERLVQRVVDSIIKQTELKSEDDVPLARCKTGGSSPADVVDNAVWRSDQMTKVINTGPKKKTFHREELTMSRAERDVKAKVEQNARTQQKRKTNELSSAQRNTSARSEPSKKSSPQQTTGATADTARKPAQQSPLSAKPSSDESKVKVQTSDGRQGQITLSPDTTYDQLRDMIRDQFGVEPAQQRLRYGFPPRELAPGAQLPPLHGDRLTVEITAPKSSADSAPDLFGTMLMEREPATELSLTAATKNNRESWSSEEIAPQGDIADWFGIRIKRLLASGGRLGVDAMETLVLEANDRARTLDVEELRAVHDSLAFTVRRLCLPYIDLWKIVQRHERLFESGGLYYRSVNRDETMQDDKELVFSSLPGKVFRYNRVDDRCEVFVEPYGYYRVEKDVEDKVATEQWRADDQSHVTIDHWKPVDPSDDNDWETQSGTFTGNGHSLIFRDSTARTTNSSKSWSDWGSNPSIDYVQGHVFKGEGQTLGGKESESHLSYLTRATQLDSSTKRIGPGYSVLSHDSMGVTQNLLNKRAAEYKAKVENLMEVIKANMYRNEEEEDSLAEASREGRKSRESDDEDMDLDSDGSS